MSRTRGTFVRRDSVATGSGPATRGLRKHSVVVAMLLLIGVQGSAMAASEGTVVAPAQQVSAAGATAVAAVASSVEKDAGLIAVVSTEIVFGGILLVGLKRRTAERRELQG